MPMGARFDVHNVTNVEVKRREHNDSSLPKFHTLTLVVKTDADVEHEITLFSDAPVGVTDHVTDAVA